MSEMTKENNYEKIVEMALQNFEDRHKFDKEEAKHNLERIKLEAKLSHPFALKMALLICSCVMIAIVLLGIYFGDKTPLVIGITIGAAIIFAIISFKTTYSALV